MPGHLHPLELNPLVGRAAPGRQHTAGTHPHVVVARVAVGVEAVSTQAWRAPQQRRPRPRRRVHSKLQNSHVPTSIRPDRDPPAVDHLRAKRPGFGLDEVHLHPAIGSLLPVAGRAQHLVDHVRTGKHVPLVD
jgi:hypothetical protein